MLIVQGVSRAVRNEAYGWRLALALLAAPALIIAACLPWTPECAPFLRCASLRFAFEQQCVGWMGGFTHTAPS